MGNGSICLKPIKELLGMNFYIPDYQRGYRWEKQQVEDLLEDIKSFLERTANKLNSSEIYCIQPLVVQLRNDKNEKELLNDIKCAASIEKVKEYLKEQWSVVDGQQRLTTIFLILKYLDEKDIYSIEYQTRDNSSDFLNNITLKNEKDSEENIDFYHMYKVKEAISEWFNKTENKNIKECFKKALLEKVNFIWYRVSDSEKDLISVFTRLNIGKIPLTDAELIKALFLNRSSFNEMTSDFDALQLRIAMEWDEIERELQNDEFWLFVHDENYDKPTRIDFIFDLILENAPSNDTKNLGNDEHKTFRYYYNLFKNFKNEKDQTKWLEERWNEIRKYYQILNEWYHDYKMYHYIGYISTLENKDLSIAKLIKEYDGKVKKNIKKSKNEFIVFLKKKIREHLESKYKKWFKSWDTYTFDEEDKQPKKECVCLLLLHNIETIIQQNKHLDSDEKYSLPNFSKFPFHLYKKEHWQVEHIHPNAGENLKDETVRKKYLLLAHEYIKGKDSDLTAQIDKYLKDDKSVDFGDIFSKICNLDSHLKEENKNTISNFTLLDETTNKEYGNSIFPIKRRYVINKDNGYKITYEFDELKLTEKVKSRCDEVAFIPPCTKNVFAKSYTPFPDSMHSWTEQDANYYLEDIRSKLDYYLKNKE